MGKYKLINNVLGWVVFLIASTVYLMTMEPTASFWDCGEFISSAYKLEVGHPPGAPFFMLTANLFTQFASDPSKVAVMVNTMSALFSGLTILFLFWSITHLARKIIVEDDKTMSLGQMITIMGCGLVGSLAYTFSDTFWFSAVEGEVYAYSSLFTALVFWLILKWEEAADRPHADRWIVLIAYLMGLSIGVHLLNLLCIPAIVLVYYYKKFPNPTMKGTLIALLVSFAIVGLMMYGVVQGLVEVCGYFELLFVNTFGMPYNSGVYAFVIILAASLIWAIWETMQDEIHPVRMNGTVIGAPQTFDYFKQIQDRITGFVCGHCNVTQPRMEALMMNQGMLTKDLGTILVGREAVREGIISEVGGISDAMKKLHSLMGHTSDGQKKKNSNSDKKRIK